MQQIETGKKIDLKKNIILLISTILFFLLILEILLRIFSYPVYGFQKGVFTYDTIIGYKLTSNYSGMQTIYGREFELKTNSEGMRDFREYNYNKSKNSYRILVLGDSFSMGNGVNLNESYPEYLRQNFAGKNVDVINLGVPGYGINNEYLSFLEEGIKYHPDMVIIQFSPNDWGVDQIIENGNKSYIDKNHSLIADKNGFLVEGSNEGVIRSVHLFFLRTSRTYSFFYTTLRKGLSSIIDKYWRTQSGVPPYFYNFYSPEYKEAYNGYFSLVQKIKNMTDAKIVLFAGPFEIELVSKEEIKKEYNIDYNVNPKQTKWSIEDIGSKLNLSVVSIEYNNTDIFLPVDMHWNSKGNKIVADELFKEVSKEIEKT